TGAFVRAFMKNVPDAAQTVRLSGAEAESKLVFDPKLATPPKYDIKLTKIFEKGAASKDDIANLFKEINGIPPTKRTEAPVALNFDSVPPYPADKVTPFKDDAKDSMLREKVREAIQLLKENNQSLQEVFIRNFDPNNQQAANGFKNQIAQIQMNAGLVQFK